MNWKNLNNYKCPKCSKVLRYDDMNEMHLCIACDFKISKERFEVVLKDMFTKKKPQSDDERLSELNNFGRPEVAEDFSDSPALDN